LFTIYRLNPTQYDFADDHQSVASKHLITVVQAAVAVMLQQHERDPHFQKYMKLEGEKYK